MRNLEEKLGYKFKDEKLLKTALTHKSVKGGANNERLEFLGDAVMDLVIGDYLFHKFSRLILSDAFEALMGAIYLESGFDAVRAASLKAFERCYPDINFDRMVKDYKTALQELTQARFAEIPKYVLVGSKGPDHKKEFEIALMLNEREISRAAGKSKKEAEQKAAKTALEILGEGK